MNLNKAKKVTYNYAKTIPLAASSITQAKEKKTHNDHTETIFKNHPQSRQVSEKSTSPPRGYLT